MFYNLFAIKWCEALSPTLSTWAARRASDADAARASVEERLHRLAECLIVCRCYGRRFCWVCLRVSSHHFFEVLLA